MAIVGADAGFSNSPPAASLCGFRIPKLFVSFSLNIPFPKLPPFPPKLTLSLGINCDLNNPLSFSASLPWGGGRVGTRDPDPDDQTDIDGAP
jgi:hypothetical protein